MKRHEYKHMLDLSCIGESMWREQNMFTFWTFLRRWDISALLVLNSPRKTSATPHVKSTEHPASSILLNREMCCPTQLISFGFSAIWNTGLSQGILQARWVLIIWRHGHISALLVLTLWRKSYATPQCDVHRIPCWQHSSFNCAMCCPTQVISFGFFGNF